jgi:hypothetical protein
MDWYNYLQVLYFIKINIIRKKVVTFSTTTLLIHLIYYLIITMGQMCCKDASKDDKNHVDYTKGGVKKPEKAESGNLNELLKHAAKNEEKIVKI